MTDEDIRATAAASAIQLVNGMYGLGKLTTDQYRQQVAKAIHAIILLIKTANFYGYLVGFTDDVTEPDTAPPVLDPPPSPIDPSHITATSTGH